MSQTPAVLTGKRIVLGVTGGIAAYKAVELVRRLRESGAEVRVVMTRGAEAFVQALTFQAVSGQPVHRHLLDESAEAAMGHIELARWAELVLVAPATADFMARLAAGLADDLLSTLCLATRAPLVLAPAMNNAMWDAAATRHNLDLLRSRDVRILGPDDGAQACGEFGPGRLMEPEALVSALAGSSALAGRRVMVTAGPTYEDIDPVRFVGNRSSGRMGYAVAAAARDEGAEVVLVSGPSRLPTPAGILRVDVRSAMEMHEAVMSRLEGIDIFIGAAAVADFRPISRASSKIKKGQQERMTVELERNPDILAEVAALKNQRPFTVGFAAETDSVAEHARGKLERKQLDMIAANRVGSGDCAFDVGDNELLVIWPKGDRSISRAAKPLVAAQLMQLIIQQFEETRKAIDNG